MDLNSRCLYTGKLRALIQIEVTHMGTLLRGRASSKTMLHRWTIELALGAFSQVASWGVTWSYKTTVCSKVSYL